MGPGQARGRVGPCRDAYLRSGPRWDEARQCISAGARGSWRRAVPSASSAHPTRSPCTDRRHWPRWDAPSTSASSRPLPPSGVYTASHWHLSRAYRQSTRRCASLRTRAAQSTWPRWPPTRRGSGAGCDWPTRACPRHPRARPRRSGRTRQGQSPATQRQTRPGSLRRCRGPGRPQRAASYQHWRCSAHFPSP